MKKNDPLDVVYGGMEKLGPGSDEHTLQVLRSLPEPPGPSVVDAGCGTGRQTLALAGELKTTIHAVDLYEPFLEQLRKRAAQRGLDHLVKTYCLNMREIPEVFPDIDLLWSEGAAYNIGFPEALATWARAIKPGGFAAVSELSWMTDEIPDEARDFFGSCYPEMQSVEENIRAAESAGYKVLSTFVLPRETWVDGYYEILAPRSQALLTHPDPAVRRIAEGNIREIEVFDFSGDSYGYVFYVLQRV